MGKPSDYFKDRYRSQARIHAGVRTDSNEGSILPLHHSKSEINTHQAGGLDEKDVGPGIPSSSGAQQLDGGQDGRLHRGLGGAANSGERGAEEPTHNHTADATSRASPPPAPPPDKSEATRSGDTALKTGDGDGNAGKPPITKRMIAGCKRFATHTKDALFHSWVNLLLVFVPIGIIAEAVGLSPGIIFGMNAVAIVPLAGMLAYATESVAMRLGDTLGALLNVSFGNAVELIIFIIALVKNEINIVQASLIGSILSNLLLILGMAFLLGGLRYKEQIYNSTVTQMSACLLSIAVMSLLLPTAFHASFNDASAVQADDAVLKLSRGTSVILLIVYVLYLVFQLKSHAYMYESTPQEVIDEESHPGVLADIMNSSSSSSESSSSDSSDTDTSGSIMTTGKRIRKKMFRNRRRRKSNASVSSTTPSSVVPSALSSPSTTERQGSYWEHQITNHSASRRESNLGVIASGDEGDAETEGGRHNIMPRIRDFVQNSSEAPPHNDEKSPERKKSKRKHHKKHHKKRRNHDDDQVKFEEPEQMTADEEKKSPIKDVQPKVGFADDVQTVENDGPTPIPGQSPAKTSFNMRQLSSRVAYRPALPKMLSNTVFATPPPQQEAARSYQQPIRHQPGGNGRIRRASSLPDLAKPNKMPSTTPSATRSDPLPPFQHQRAAIRKVKSEGEGNESGGEEEEKENMSRTAAVVLLLISTALVAVCAEFMVDAIPDMLDGSPVGEAFIGLIILPIVSNAAEHVTAVTVAAKNKMDLAIGVAVGSSIQIALFVTPIVVLLGWILQTDMSLYFNLFQTVSLFVTAFVVNFLVLDGRSNYLEGALLIAAYIIIAVAAFFYPHTRLQSAVGGGATSG